jgi:ubiquinone/menaquinone biosynthesis C-methylase UbiE
VVDVTPGDATERFSDRVVAYTKARPDYPTGVVDVLRTRAGLGPGSVVADVGAGTGIFTRMLARTGAQVHAVEPNGSMLAALIEGLGPSSSVRTHRRPAEATNLSDTSIDLVTVAQAFHWFDQESAGREFRRILRPGGAVALIWNERVVTTPFLVGYEELLRRWATDYTLVDHRNVTVEVIERFFDPGTVEYHAFDHHQVLDLPLLRDRLLSSSYTPAAEDPARGPMLAELTDLFARHAEGGTIRFAYRTQLHLGWFA